MRKTKVLYGGALAVLDMPGMADSGFTEIKTAAGWIPLGEFRSILSGTHLEKWDDGKTYLVEPDRATLTGQVRRFDSVFELR